MAKLGGKKADIGREQSTSSSPFCTAAFKLPAKIREVGAAEYLFNRVYLFARSARFVKITRNRVVRGIWRGLSRAAAVQFHSVAKGGRGVGRTRLLPRMRTHLHNCAYKFRTLPEGFGWLIARCVSTPMLQAAVPRSQIPNSIRMNYLCEHAAILKRGCNFQPSHPVFAFRIPVKCFILIRSCGLNVLSRCN